MCYILFNVYKNIFSLYFWKKTNKKKTHRISPDLAMLMCIFSLFLSAYRTAFIHAIMLKTKAASWQNYLLMYWPSESVGMITEPRVCRGLPKQFCIQAGSLFSISSRRPDEPLATKKKKRNQIPQHATKNQAERWKRSKKQNVLETRPAPVCRLFWIFPSSRTSVGMLKIFFPPLLML